MKLSANLAMFLLESPMIENEADVKKGNVKVKRYYAARVRFDKCWNNQQSCYATYTTVARSTLEAKRKIETMSNGIVLAGTLRQLPDGVFRFSN